MANPEDDEWEYEYDDAATEDFYIALDLSHTVPSALSTNPDEQDEDSNPVPKDITTSPEFLKSRLRQPKNKSSREESVDQAVESRDACQLQVTGLHTQNPLVAFNGRIYSCDWASTIGTDMFFTKRTSEADPKSKPLRSLHAADLIAVSNTKLVGIQSRLRPRNNLPEAEDIRNPQSQTNILRFQAEFERAKVVRKQNQKKEKAAQWGRKMARRRRALARQRAGEAELDTESSEEDENGWGSDSDTDGDTEMGESDGPQDVSNDDQISQEED